MHNNEKIFLQCGNIIVDNQHINIISKSFDYIFMNIFAKCVVIKIWLRQARVLIPIPKVPTMSQFSNVNLRWEYQNLHSFLAAK